MFRASRELDPDPIVFSNKWRFKAVLYVFVLYPLDAIVRRNENEFDGIVCCHLAGRRNFLSRRLQSIHNSE